MGIVQQVVYLVRHGESEWNVQGLTQGQIAHPRLTASGREQAEVVAAELLARTGPDATWGRVVVSDLARAHETGKSSLRAWVCRWRSTPDCASVTWASGRAATTRWPRPGWQRIPTHAVGQSAGSPQPRCAFVRSLSWARWTGLS